MKINATYSAWKTIKKALIGLALFAVPVLIDALPEAWMNMTVGGLLIAAWDFVKHALLSKRGGVDN